jgi:hypothetical protein
MTSSRPGSSDAACRAPRTGADGSCRILPNRLLTSPNYTSGPLHDNTAATVMHANCCQIVAEQGSCQIVKEQDVCQVVTEQASEHHHTPSTHSSSFRYPSQESFDKFLVKSELLFAEIFPRRTGYKLTTTRMKGGGFNRILGLEIRPRKHTLVWHGIRHFFTCCSRKNVFARPVKYILHAPREADRPALDME